MFGALRMQMGDELAKAKFNVWCDEVNAREKQKESKAKHEKELNKRLDELESKLESILLLLKREA